MSDMRPYTATMPNAGAEGCLKHAGHRRWWCYTIIIRIRYLPPDQAYSCGVSDIRYEFNFFSPTSRVAMLCSELCHLTSVLVCMSALGSLYSSALVPVFVRPWNFVFGLFSSLFLKRPFELLQWSVYSYFDSSWG